MALIFHDRLTPVLRKVKLSLAQLQASVHVFDVFHSLSTFNLTKDVVARFQHANYRHSHSYMFPLLVLFFDLAQLVLFFGSFFTSLFGLTQVSKRYNNSLEDLQTVAFAVVNWNALASGFSSMLQDQVSTVSTLSLTYHAAFNHLQPSSN